MKRYTRLTAGIAGAWFILVVCAAALHVFENASNAAGFGVALAALAPIAVFASAYAGSEGFRKFTLSLNVRTLTFAQSWRLAGLLFVVLQAYGVLPAIFALPAGYGDMAVGATASLAAVRLSYPKHRNSFIAWQLLGIADLVLAVSLGATARLLSPNGGSMAAMTVLPLSLVPTFIVPLLLIFHLVCIAQAKRWRSPFGNRRETGETVEDLGAGGFPPPRVA